MMNHRILLALAGLLLFTPDAGEAQGILDRVKQRVRERAEEAVDRTVDRAAACVAGDEACRRRRAGADSTAAPAPAPVPRPAPVPAAPAPAVRPASGSEPSRPPPAAEPPTAAAPSTGAGSTPPSPPPSAPANTTAARAGTLSLAYSGEAGSGRISAAGARPASAGIAEFAAAAPYAGAGSAAVAALKPRAGGGFDQVALKVVGGQAGGSLPLAGECTGLCPQVTLYLDHREGRGPEWTCRLTAGTIQVVAVDGTRVRGTFSGRGPCTSAAGRVVPQGIAVEGGSFDVWFPDAG